MTDAQPGPMDRIFIRDLLVRCIVGVNEHERRAEQDVLVQITLYVDLHCAGRTDSLDDTVDYSGLKKRIKEAAEKSRFYLVEALAQRIADECLEDSRVKAVSVVVEKPGALRFARTVGVEIFRHRAADAGQAS
jgi:FolB domain-containing protein